MPINADRLSVHGLLLISVLLWSLFAVPFVAGDPINVLGGAYSGSIGKAWRASSTNTLAMRTTFQVTVQVLA
jgi:hypothetical protein